MDRFVPRDDAKRRYCVCYGMKRESRRENSRGGYCHNLLFALSANPYSTVCSM